VSATTRVDYAARRVFAGETAWTFDLDCRSGALTVTVALDGGPLRLRSLRWREKVALARFAALGPAAVEEQVLRLAVEGDHAAPYADDIRAALLALIDWLEGLGDDALPLSSPVMAAVTLDVCAASGLAPSDLDDRDAADVESLWRATARRSNPPAAEAPAGGGAADDGEWTRIVFGPDAGPPPDQAPTPRDPVPEAAAGDRPGARTEATPSVLRPRAGELGASPAPLRGRPLGEAWRDVAGTPDGFASTRQPNPEDLARLVAGRSPPADPADPPDPATPLAAPAGPDRRPRSAESAGRRSRDVPGLEPVARSPVVGRRAHPFAPDRAGGAPPAASGGSGTVAAIVAPARSPVRPAGFTRVAFGPLGAVGAEARSPQAIGPPAGAVRPETRGPMVTGRPLSDAPGGPGARAAIDTDDLLVEFSERLARAAGELGIAV
jgi:hypothetical protein